MIRRRIRSIWLRLEVKTMKMMLRKKRQPKKDWRNKILRAEKMLNHKNSERDLVSNLHWNKLSHIKRNILHPMISLMVNCQNSLIGVMLMATILLAKLEIKVRVAHATQLHLLKQWSHD